VDIESNRKHAFEFLKLLGSGRAAESRLTAGFRAWTIASGDLAGQEYLERTKLLPKIFQTPLTMEIDSSTAEGDRVAIQCRGTGTLINGAAYRNTYVFLFGFEGDRIARLSEYFNVQTVAQTLAPVMRSLAAKS
jgi:ketosteroid isomerase-like protein